MKPSTQLDDSCALQREPSLVDDVEINSNESSQRCTVHAYAYQLREYRKGFSVSAQTAEEEEDGEMDGDPSGENNAVDCCDDT